MTKYNPHHDKSVSAYKEHEKALAQFRLAVGEIFAKQAKNIFVDPRSFPKRPMQSSTRPDLDSKKLLRWARDVKQRDGWVCVRCGSVSKLHAHHIKSKRIYPQLAYELSNGITLCCVCHAEEHNQKSSGLASFPSW